MIRFAQTLAPLILLTLAACASDTHGGTAGTGGAGGNGGTGGTGDTGFPAEGPESVLREETDDFVYFFPQSLEAETKWPALVRR